MSLTIRVVLVLLLTALPVYASLDMLSFADSLAAEQDHYRAITEYKRFLHYHPDDPRSARAQLQIGRSLLAGERWLKADDALEKVWTRYPGSAEAAIARKLYASAAYRRGDLVESEKRYQTLKQTDPQQKQLADYQLGLTMLKLDRPQKAGQHFARLEQNELSYSLEQYLQLEKKSPQLAGTLSAILPGAGQLYTERPRQAGIALALNAAFIYGAVEAWDNENYALSAVLSLFELGWYGGNIYNAMNNAHKYNRDQRQNFIDKLQQRFDLSLGWRDNYPTLSTRVHF